MQINVTNTTAINRSRLVDVARFCRANTVPIERIHLNRFESLGRIFNVSFVYVHLYVVAPKYDALSVHTRIHTYICVCSPLDL